MNKLTAGATGNRTELDMNEGVSIPLTLKIADVKTPSKRSGSYSKTIKLPSTRVNNAFFGGLYDVNADFTQFNPNVRTDCILTIDDKEVITGFLQLRTIDVDDLGDITYNVVLYDSTVNFITEIGSLLVIDNPKTITEKANNTKSVNDIKFNDEPLATPAIVRDTQVDMNHVYNYDALTTSWNVDANKWQNLGYFYPLLYSSKSVLTIQDFQPAIFHKTLLDGIIKHHGYTWSGSLKTNDNYNNEIIPYTGSAPQEAEILALNRTMKVGVNDVTPPTLGTQNIFSFIAPDPTVFFGAVTSNVLTQLNGETQGDFSDSNNLWNTSTYIYTAPNISRYYFQYNVNMSVTIDYETDIIISVPDLFYKLRLSIKAEVYNDLGVLQYTTDPQLIGETLIELDKINSSNNSSFQNIDGTVTPFIAQRISEGTNDNFVDLKTDWTVKFLFLIDSDGLEESDGTLYTGNAQDVKELSVDLYSGLYGGHGKTYMQCLNVRNNISEWQNIDYSDFIPKKLKQVDIINDLIARYNCFVYTNPENSNDIIFDIGEDFYSSAPVVDWSTKKDNSQRDEITMLGSTLSASALLTYTEAKDTNNVAYQDATGEVFGQYEYDFDNDFAKGVNSIKSPFEPTPLALQGGTSLAIVPLLSASSTTAKFRLLYASPTLINPRGAGNDYYFRIEYRPVESSDAKLSPLRFTYPYAGCYNYPLDPDTLVDPGNEPTEWESINFGQLAFLDVNLGTTQPERTLEFLYWRNTLRQVSLSKLLVAYFDLTPSDVDYVRLNPNVKVWVNNKYWSINVVTFEGNSNIRRLTKVELVSIE